MFNLSIELEFGQAGCVPADQPGLVQGQVQSQVNPVAGANNDPELLIKTGT
jgi:hypothetical protein